MKRHWFLIPIIVLILIFFSIPRLILIPRLSQELQSDLQQSLYTEEVQVNIRAPWGWELVGGRIPDISITVKDGTLEGLDISWAEFHGTDLHFEANTLWRERELKFTDLSGLDGELFMSEAALNELFWREVDPDRHLKVLVSPEGLGLQGTVSLWNMEWAINLLGELEMIEGSALRFVIKNIEVHETRIPSVLLEVLSSNYNFLIDLGGFPYPVEITGIHLLEQEIMVTIGGLQ